MNLLVYSFLMMGRVYMETLLEHAKSFPLTALASCVDPVTLLSRARQINQAS